MAKLIIGGREVRPGERVQIELPVAKLYTDTDICMPIQIIRSKRSGPTVFVSAAVHGDELNGIEIIRRLIQTKSPKIRAGTIILVPIVNVYGVLNQSRYMPDRRDLNRSFPGSEKGSLAARVADIFLAEIVRHCDYGIDLHTGGQHRSNLPQIRADLKDTETLELARAFGVPVLVNADLRDGSLREAAVAQGTKVLLYEAGQALRFDELSIRAGVKGVLNVLAKLDMVKSREPKKRVTPFMANHTTWVRANYSGIVKQLKGLGDKVSKGEILASIGNPFGDSLGEVRAPRAGVVIGRQNIPLVQEGDAMFHLAYFSADSDEILENIEMLQDSLLPNDADYLSQV